MKYYTILLLKGKVIRICSYNEKCLRDKHVIEFKHCLDVMTGLAYDDIQTYNEGA